MNPKISVIIPAYNGAVFLPQTLKSVFQQTYQPFEIIVIDDGSTDNTPDVLKPFEDKIIYHRKENGGAAKAMNTGMQMAKGDFIAILEQDDLWFKHKLEKQVDLMLKYPDVGVTCANFVTRFAGKDTPLKRHFHRLRLKDTYNFDAPLAGDNLQIMMKENFVCTFSSVMIRRNIIEKIGVTNPEFRICFDFEYWIRCAKVTKFALQADILLFKRVHGGNLSFNAIKRCKEHKNVLIHFLKESFFLNKQFINLAKLELGKSYYELGDAYYECGQTMQAFHAYWRGFLSQVSIGNGILFLKKFCNKFIRLLSFNLLSRRNIRKALVRT
ncbi:MAG: glycosyltransferase [Candidatus Omnitrophica bacterium]|nr:glycosyltransferase [Candidatus Omnitrophota bacterium]MCB9747529.1 glycosyltransferase [Candidatus Omnitrophota bacterium]